jgi:hypothetical protein
MMKLGFVTGWVLGTIKISFDARVNKRYALLMNNQGNATGPELRLSSDPVGTRQGFRPRWTFVTMTRS